MDRVRNAGAIAAVVALATPALAEHDHSHHHHAVESTFVASIGALAATYDSMFYEGDYQGATLGAKWSRGRFEVGAAGAAYQIDRNGLTYRGFGDLMVHGAATIVENDGLAAGAHLMVMVPVGEEMDGLGMGHWMVMPAAWGTYAKPRGSIGGSIGYARGIGSENAHAEHGGGAAWPLVDPMSFSEVTFDATGMLALAESLRAGVRMLGALPFDDDARLIGAARIAWRTGRLETTAEAQLGIAGDPVGVRGLVSTAMRF
jgi:hypothetical protein